MKDCTIRAMQPSDMEQVLDIWLEASIRAHPFQPATYWENALPAMRLQYLPMSENFVAEQEGKVLGFLAMLNNYIAALFVEPAVQGKGIGSCLLDYARANHDTLSLAVYQQNQQAVNFYLKNGFQIREETINSETGDPEYQMYWESRTINP